MTRSTRKLNFGSIQLLLCNVRNFSTHRSMEPSPAPTPAPRPPSETESAPAAPTSKVDFTTLSDEELAALVVAGTVAPHSLEADLGNCARAVRVRRAWLERSMGVGVGTLPHDVLDCEAFYSSVKGACAEMVVGFVPLPVGVAGPLLLNGKSYQVPMATVEGTLIASTRRGCKAITESGGAQAAVLQQGMTRAPVLQFPSAMRAVAFKQWLEDPVHFEEAKAQFESTTRFGKLLSVKVTVAGRFAYARFMCATGDAMGMNMVSKVQRIPGSHFYLHDCFGVPVSASECFGVPLGASECCSPSPSCPRA